MEMTVTFEALACDCSYRLHCPQLPLPRCAEMNRLHSHRFIMPDAVRESPLMARERAVTILAPFENITWEGAK